MVRFENSEDSLSIIDGFTITNGGNLPTSQRYLEGGGIYIKKARPQLKNLIIEKNHKFYVHTRGTGGGIYCDSGKLNAINLKIRRNTCGDGSGGGGIFVSNSSVILNNCIIKNNHTQFIDDFGGLVFQNVNFLIQNSTIENNFSTFLYAPPPHSILISESTGKFVNTIINDTLLFNNSNIQFINCTINGRHIP